MDDDALAGEAARACGITEVAALIPRHVDLHRLRRLHPDVVRLQHRTGDGEVVCESCCPLVDVRLLQVLLSLRLDRLAHLSSLRLKGIAQLATTVEEQVVHATENTGG